MAARTDFGAGYVPRVLDEELDDLFPELPAVLLDGPEAYRRRDGIAVVPRGLLRL